MARERKMTKHADIGDVPRKFPFRSAIPLKGATWRELQRGETRHEETCHVKFENAY